MLPVLVAVSLVPAAYAPPSLWASGFAAPPRIPLVGDVDGDGYADLICVYPPGGSIIDVALNQKGQKPGVPFQALNPWGKDCEAAIAADVDGVAGADVVGLFAGDTLRLAHAFENGKFKDEDNWVKLPRKLIKGKLVREGGSIFAFDGKGAYAIDPKTRTARAGSIPKTSPGPELPASKLPVCPAIRLSADMDGDGDLDIVEYRYGQEKHTAYDILIYRNLTAKNDDEDADGLTNEQEAALGTDPLNPDTDNDGLLDGWEVGAYRDLDLKALGCSPLKQDMICLISRYSNVDKALVDREIERVRRTFSELDTPNPDGTKGLAFHPIFLDPVEEKDHPNPWWANRDKFRPTKWRGLVHWMQITPGGGGQADQMGDGGGCGANALWAVFLHEFGHQIGMNHEGFWEPGLCPIYTSLMNYAYSYSYEDDPSKIHFSNGRFKDFVLDERSLDETLPFPYDEVKFLEKGPYRFRLKPAGDKTLIDWNWNGIFGEKGIRADINYSYSTNAGRRDEIGKIMTSPWLFVHQGKAFAIYGTHTFPGDVKTDPTISLDKPGDLWLRRLKEPFKWEEPRKINGEEKLVGDPVAISQGKEIVYAYAAKGPGAEQGVYLKKIDSSHKVTNIGSLANDPELVPTIGSYHGTTYVFLWDPKTGAVTYRTVDPKGRLSEERRLLRRSTIPVGMAVDAIRNEVILGAAEDQDKNRPTRWQIRRYKEIGGHLLEQSVEWIEGEAGQSRGYGRCTVLFDASKEAGKEGRIYFYGRGMTSKESPWACTYVAHQIADKTVRGGWLVKRFYDEWTQSRSAPAAAWFGNDVIWAYRWVDGSQNDRDNLFHVGYRALGFDDKPMGDHDDISFFREIGIRHSILYLGNP
jgi:hypothetical protein